MAEDFTAVFRETFKGREDVVPRYWKSKRGDKSGYSPLCRNEWKEGVCKKPCRDCPNSDHIPLTDDLLLKHFQGKHILGVYPLSLDGSCWFIAADFDDHGENGGPPRDPLHDAVEFHAVCEAQAIPCYLERSKSGKGLHAWIFFDAPVPAWKARAVAFALLREAGVIGEDEQLSSFDRLFPNQDNPSGKGFGNLIAMPYQGRAADHGHTLFLDPASGFKTPFTNQPEVLRTIQRATEADLDRIIKAWDLKLGSTKPAGTDDRNKVMGRSPILDCSFIRNCEEYPSLVSEPLWYALISNVARIPVGGPDLCHALSRNHPKYNPSETDAKIIQGLNASGPHTCEWIRNNGYDCQRKCSVKAPVGLAAPVAHEQEAPADPPCIEITEHSAARFLDTPPPAIDWHFKGEPGSLKAGTFGIIVADGGTGKGHLLLQAGLSTATRIPFLDGLFEVPENAHGKCVLILGEDSEDILHRRFTGICDSLVFDAGSVPGTSSNDKLFRDMIRENLFIISTCGMDLTLTSFANGEMSTTPMFGGLLESLMKLGNLKLVCIDPLSRIFSGDENDPAQTTYLATLMEKISTETGAGILVAHHTNKYSQQTDTAHEALTQHAVRGSTGLVNACRWMLTMANVKQGEWRALGIPRIDVPRYVAAQVTKSNYSSKGGCFYLRRDDNGCLRLANIEGEHSERDGEVTEAILKTIAADPNKYTKNAFARVFAKEFSGYGRPRLERLIDRALREGHLVTIPATNKKGIQVEFLAVSDSYESG